MFAPLSIVSYETNVNQRYQFNWKEIKINRTDTIRYDIFYKSHLCTCKDTVYNIYNVLIKRVQNHSVNELYLHFSKTSLDKPLDVHLCSFKK